MKILVVITASFLLNACSIISLADTTVDLVLLPVKVTVAVVEIVIPDDDEEDD
ncbi:MAG: hypothetical protein ABGY08_10735 [Gammaproteobacteria bacterium]